MTKYTKIALASALAISSASAFAEITASGTVDAFIAGGIGYNDTKTGNGDSSKQNQDFRATFAYTDKSGFGGQFDALYTAARFSGQGGAFSLADIKIGDTDLAGHLYYRTGYGVFGVFGQHRTFNTEINSDNPFYSLLISGLIKERNFVGIEGQGYFGENTIYARFGTQSLPIRTGNSFKGEVANVEARHFLTPNWKLNASVDYDRIGGNGANMTNYTYSAGTEYRFDNNPISVYANYDYSTMDFGGNASGGNMKFDINRFMVGVKLNFGKETLRARDREGAAFDPIKPTYPLIGAGLSVMPN